MPCQRFIAVLIPCLLISFSCYSIPFTTSLPDTLIPLRTRGIVISEAQARLAVKYRLDAENFFFRINELNQVIAGKDSVISVLKNHTAQLEIAAWQDARTIARLKQKLARRSGELWIWRGLGALKVYLSTQKLFSK